jgi:hypothetical protein
MLDRLDEKLWAVTSPLKVLSLILMASRMTVARLGRQLFTRQHH